MSTKTYNIHHELIERCKMGKQGAYYEVYKLYSKAMYNVSLRIVNDCAEAEDVLQEAFTSAFKNLRSYKGDSTFGAWLKRIVINKSLNIINKRKHQIEQIDAEADISDESDITEFDNHQLSVEKIKKAVSLLPDGYRSVFTLYAFDGYDHNEIAEIMGITASTSKSQYNRSKKKLKKLLASEELWKRAI